MRNEIRITPRMNHSTQVPAPASKHGVADRAVRQNMHSFWRIQFSRNHSKGSTMKTRNKVQTAAAVKLLPQSYKDKGELTVAMDLHYPPTTFLADDNVTPIGLNPDIARLVAKKLGLKLKFENTAFDTIIPGIDGGRYDFTATTMSPTAERLKVLDMVDYLNTGVSVAVAHGNPLNISNDNMCGRNIAVTKGSNAQLKHLPNISKWTCEEKGK